MPDALATVDDLAAVLVRELTDAELTAGQRLLEFASGRFRRETRQLISAVAGDTVSLYGTRDRKLLLPERPVTAVTSVTVAGQAVDPSEYTIRSWGLERQWGWWGDELLVVNVGYDHGYALNEIPDDIVEVVSQWARDAMVNPSAVKSMSLGSYAVAFDRVGITDDQQDVIDDYRVEAPGFVATASLW